jgi:hypothetical protein
MLSRTHCARPANSGSARLARHADQATGRQKIFEHSLRWIVSFARLGSAFLSEPQLNLRQSSFQNLDAPG